MLASSKTSFCREPEMTDLQQNLRMAMDIISRYDVDGLNFDYIRYTGNTWGYHPIAVSRFNARYGRTGTPSPTGLRSMRVIGRTKLLVLVPGATGDPSGATDSPGSFGLFSANGNRGRSNNYLLDGTDMNDGYRNLPELIARARQGERASATDFRSWEHYEDVTASRHQAAAQAFVTVQRGCDYRCTFCIVPMTRGPEQSRKLGDVVREVTSLAATGTTEVTLLGQTVNSYSDGEHDFADLLRAAGAVPGIRRVRFTSPYPTDFTDRVLRAMAETPAVCEHVHLPVQSGSSRVLKRMLRRYDRERYLAVVRELREAVPGVALTTDIIVGFPGETEDDFAETMSLVQAVRFDDAYTFMYSPRDGTPATRLKDAVPDDVSGERLERLIAVVRGVARQKNIALVGTTHEVLVEGRARRGTLLQTRTRTNRVVLVHGPDAWIGTYRRVRLTGTTGSTFTGWPLEPSEELVVSA